MNEENQAQEEGIAELAAPSRRQGAKSILAYLLSTCPLHLQRMPPGKDALPSDIFHPSISTDWPQSNQRIHRVTSDLDASRVYNKLGGSDSDDHLRMMMQTRVAVRDKTPHRFQIVPLREVPNFGSKQTARSHSLNIQTTPMNILHDSPTGKLAPCSPRRLQSLSHFRSLKPCDESREARKPVCPDDIYSGSPQESLATKPDIAHRSGGQLHSRRVLVELDLNRDTRVPTATTKPFGSKSTTMHSRNLLTPFSRTETSTAPRASTGHHSLHDMKPNTLTTLGTHISEISLLFSSENVASQPPMRRNRSMTGSSMRSDTSVGMSDASQETEAKLKRRHAIYRESCMPYLGRSQGKDIVVFDNLSNRNLAKGVMGTKVDKGINFDQDAGSAGLTHPPFELKQYNLAGRPKIQQLPNSGAGGLFPMQALKLSKKIDKHVTRRMPAICGEIAHPQIVLDLLRDIDEEIAQWTQT